MAGTHTQFDPTVIELRRKYLAPGLDIRVTNITDALGGYTARVVEGGDLCWITVPLRRDGLLNLTIGELVSIRFDRDGDAAYLFDTVVSQIRDDDVAPYGVAWPVSIDRRAHRVDVRLALVLDAEYQHLDDDDRSPHVAKIVDLSASGLALICDEELHEPTHVRVRATLPHPDRPVALDQPAEVRTKVMYGRTPNGSVLWRYGLQLGEVDDTLREEILASVVWNLTRNPAVL